MEKLEKNESIECVSLEINALSELATTHKWLVSDVGVFQE